MMQIDISLQIKQRTPVERLPAMKASFQISTIAVLLNLMAIANATPQACHYESLKPGWHIFDGRYHIDPGEADDIYRPTAWQGPIKIMQPDGTSCHTDEDVNIIQAPLYTDDYRLIVSTYSGSHQTLYIVDKATCHTLWTSDEFSGSVGLKGNKLYINKVPHKFGRDCLPSKGKQ
jgi:hypothetical protein